MMSNRDNGYLQHIKRWGKLLESIRKRTCKKLTIMDILEIRRMVYFYSKVYALITSHDIAVKDMSIKMVLTTKPLLLQDETFVSVAGLYLLVYKETMNNLFPEDNTILLDVFNLALNAEISNGKSFKTKGSPGWASLEHIPLDDSNIVTCEDIGIKGIASTGVILRNGSILLLTTKRPNCNKRLLTAINLDGLVYNVLNENSKWCLGTDSNESPSFYSFSKGRRVESVIPSNVMFKQGFITHCCLEPGLPYVKDIIVLSTSKMVNARSWVRMKSNIKGYLNENLEC